MTGQLLALLSAALWAISVILFRRMGDALPATTLNFYKCAIAIALVVPSVLIWHGTVSFDGNMMPVLLILASGFIGIGIADTLFLASLARLGATRASAIESLFSPAVTLLSALFLGEVMNLPQTLGMLLVVAGVILVNLRGDDAVDSKHRTTGYLLALASVVTSAVGITLLKPLVGEQPALWVVLIRLVGGLAGVLLTVIIVQRGSVKSLAIGRNTPWAILVAASASGAWLSTLMFVMAMEYIAVDIASVLNETAVIFIVLLAWWKLGERLDTSRVAGVAMAFAGVVMVIL